MLIRAVLFSNEITKRKDRVNRYFAPYYLIITLAALAVPIPDTLSLERPLPLVITAIGFFYMVLYLKSRKATRHKKIRAK